MGLPRIPRRNEPRLSRIPESVRATIVGSLKVARYTGEGVPHSVLYAIAGEVSAHQISYYLQWLKKYGWAECDGRYLWQWTEPVAYEEIEGHAEPINYRFSFF